MSEDTAPFENPTEEQESSPNANNDVGAESRMKGVHKGWMIIQQKVLTAVNLSMNLHTLRDMYGDIALNPDRLKFVSKIADGNFGTVSRYEYTEENGETSYLAIKRLKPDAVSAPELLDFMNEVKILKQLRHSRIAAFRGTGYLPAEIPGESDDLFLAQELLTGGTLRAKLEEQRQAKDPKTYTLGEALQWLLDVALALQYLHTSEPLIIHRDLKPENIILTENKIAKIVDFGLHRVVDKWEREDALDEDGLFEVEGGFGAYIYMPPEAYLGQRYNHKVDVYSFAIVTWELVHYQLLISKVCLAGTTTEVKNFAKYVAKENYRPPISQTLPPDLIQLISEMWRQDPNKRPEFSEIVPRLRVIMENVKAQEEEARKRTEFLPQPVPVPQTHSFCSCFKFCFSRKS